MGEHATYVDVVHSVGPSTTPAVEAAAGCKGSSHSHHTAAPCRSTRPTIRIIHIVAPEIIKTDAANFRDLVQRLTGRQQQQNQPADDSTASTVGVAAEPPLPVEEERLVGKEEKAAPVRKRPAPAAPGLLAADYVVQEENKRRKKIKCEVVKVEDGSGFGGGDLDLGELWMDLNPEGFLSFLEEDVFRGMADPDFLQPLIGSSRMDFVGEMCSSYLA